MTLPPGFGQTWGGRIGRFLGTGVVFLLIYCAGGSFVELGVMFFIKTYSHLFWFPGTDYELPVLLLLGGLYWGVVFGAAVLTGEYSFAIASRWACSIFYIMYGGFVAWVLFTVNTPANVSFFGVGSDRCVHAFLILYFLGVLVAFYGGDIGDRRRRAWEREVLKAEDRRAAWREERERK